MQTMSSINLLLKLAERKSKAPHTHMNMLAEHIEGLGLAIMSMGCTSLWNMSMLGSSLSLSDPASMSQHGQVSCAHWIKLSVFMQLSAVRLCSYYTNRLAFMFCPVLFWWAFWWSLSATPSHTWPFLAHKHELMSFGWWKEAHTSCDSKLMKASFDKLLF